MSISAPRFCDEVLRYLAQEIRIRSYELGALSPSDDVLYVRPRLGAMAWAALHSNGRRAPPNPQGIGNDIPARKDSR